MDFVRLSDFKISRKRRVFSLLKIRTLDKVQKPISLSRKRFGNGICFRLQVRGRETRTLLGALEGANLNYWCNSF
jgi:hypothetical protein